MAMMCKIRNGHRVGDLARIVKNDTVLWPDDSKHPMVVVEFLGDGEQFGYLVKDIEVR